MFFNNLSINFFENITLHSFLIIIIKLFIPQPPIIYKGNVNQPHYLYIYIIYSSFNCILTPEISTLFIVKIVPPSTTEKYL